MAVDGLGVCLNQNQAFIGRHDIVIKVLDGAVAGCFHIKNSCDFYTDSKSQKTAKIEPGSSRLFPWVARF